MNQIEDFQSPNIAIINGKKPPVYNSHSAAKPLSSNTQKLTDIKNKSRLENNRSRLDISKTIDQNGVDEEDYIIPCDDNYNYNYDEMQANEESDTETRPDLIVFDHDGSEKSELEDEFEEQPPGGDNNDLKKRKGNFMSPDRLPVSSTTKLNTYTLNKNKNTDEMFTPNHVLNKSKSRMSKTDLMKKKLVDCKSVDFKKKKKKSSKKLSSLNGQNDSVNGEDDDCKFNSNANLLEHNVLNNNKSLKQRSMSKDVLKSNKSGLNTQGTESNSTQESLAILNNDIVPNPLKFESLKKYENKIRDVKAVILLKSIFLERPRVLFFQQPKALGIEKKEKDRTIIMKENRVNLRYRVENAHRYNSVLNNLKKSCFTDSKSEKWNLLWCCVVRSDLLREMAHYQKVNHFPHSFQLGRKDLMQRNFSSFRRKLPRDFDQCPQTQLLPYEFDRFKSDQAEERNPHQLWIVKPFNMACGKGIRVIGKKTLVKNRQHTLISRQIMKPHLVNNFKQDLRVQIVITSFDPLRIYKFNQGLVRFATHEYKIACKTDRFSHLTNYSVNKRSASQQQSKDVEDDTSSKWTQKVWMDQLKKNTKCDTNKLEHAIRDVCIKSCITIEPQVQNSVVGMGTGKNNCFEVQGFDVMIDKDFKPWIIEVNVLPSLSSSSPMDKSIKTSLMGDVLTLIGMNYADGGEKHCGKDKAGHLPEIYKTIKRTQRRKYLPDLENAPKLVVIDSYYQNGKINQDALRRDIDAGNYLLNEEDLEILFETEEENQRRGNLERIFPPQDVNLMRYYNNLQQNKRFNTLLVLKQLSQPDILDKVATRVSTENV